MSILTLHLIIMTCVIITKALFCAVEMGFHRFQSQKTPKTRGMTGWINYNRILILGWSTLLNKYYVQVTSPVWSGECKSVLSSSAGVSLLLKFSVVARPPRTFS